MPAGGLRIWGILLASGFVSGCGLSPPNIKEAWDGPTGTEQIEFEIKKHVYCDLKKAVAAVEDGTSYFLDGKTKKKTKIDMLPDDWGAQISLLLQVDESVGLNPGVAITEPLKNVITPFANGNVTTPQSFSLGLGGTFSSTATRIDRFNPYYSLAFLKKPILEGSACDPAADPYRKNGEIPSASSPLITTDLGLRQWLLDATVANTAIASDHPERTTSKDAADTISIDVKFVIVTSGNINPTWKLVSLTSNNGSLPLLATGRTRTHDLLITIGPPNEKTRNDHLSSQFGQAFNSVLNGGQIIR